MQSANQYLRVIKLLPINAFRTSDLFFSATKQKCEKWNIKLVENARSFTQRHPDATAMVYSSHHTFTQVLNSPSLYGFEPEDAAKGGGAIWIDHIHPTTAMHKVIAREMRAFLGNVPAFSTNE